MVKIQELPDTVDELRALVANLSNENETLQKNIFILKRLIFLRKSEKWTKEDIRQALLFDEAETEDIPEEPVQSEKITYFRRKSGRKPIDKNIPRTDVIHDLDEKDKTCACGHELTKIGEDTCEKLDIKPAEFKVTRHIHFKYACKHCEGTSDESKPGVITKKRDPDIIPKSFVTPGLLAYIFTGKFVDHIPFFRQEKIFRRLGIELPRATMCNWAIQVGTICERLMILMKKELMQSSVLCVDETPFQVMNEEGKSNLTKSYMWVFRGGTKENPLVMYEYHPTRSSDALDFLSGFKGKLVSDGYPVYDKICNKFRIPHAGCWAHARRKFFDAAKEGKKDSNSEHALKQIQKLYRVEEIIREGKLNPESILELRQNESKPIVLELEKWINSMIKEIVPSGLFGRALSYTANEFHKLKVYLDDPLLPIDNNLTENDIRPFVLGRKNWLFSGSPRGASASSTIYSLIQSAIANGLEPYWYLRYLFERIHLVSRDEELNQLLPNRILNENLKSSGYSVV